METDGTGTEADSPPGTLADGNESSGYSSEDNKPLSELKSKSPDPLDISRTVKKKSAFITEKKGIKITKRKRSFKCPVCESRFTKQGDLSEHYRTITSTFIENRVNITGVEKASILLLSYECINSRTDD